MKNFNGYSRYLTLFMALLLSAWVAGCGGGGDGGRDAILGSGGATLAPPAPPAPPAPIAPTVNAVVPHANVAGVPINTKIITAAFSKAMSAATIISPATTFTLACGAAGTAGVAGTPKTLVTGAVAYLAAGSVATLTPSANLPASADCTATITTAAKDTTGIPLANDYFWIFTTGVTADTTLPRVTLTVPVTGVPPATTPSATTGVPTNTAITAIFTEDMDPTTITAASFTLTGPGVTPVAGATVPVTYAVGSRIATFTPAATLAASTTYTATITTAAKDLAGNQLAGNQAALPAASNYVWTFTTAAAAIPLGNITVANKFPVNLAPAVCPSSTVSATFTVPNPVFLIKAATVNSTTFSVTGPGPATPLAVVGGTYALDGTGLIATFTPTAPFAPGTYTATIKSGAAGVTDTAIPSDQLLSPDTTWTFTVAPATGLCLSPIPLGTASAFGALSCAALSGSTVGTGTTVNGNIGTKLTSTSITNWVGGGSPATPGIVNGTIFASDLPSAGNTTTATAVGDAQIAFLAAQTVGASGTVIPTSDLGAIAGFGPNPLTPGTFKAGAYTSGSSIAISTPLTLDAQGDANAVWVFYSPSSTLTTTGPLGNIVLINNAQAKNVYWVVGSSATLGAPLFSGNVLAATSVSVASAAAGIIDGRLLTSGPTCAAVSFTGSGAGTVNVPAP